MSKKTSKKKSRIEVWQSKNDKQWYARIVATNHKQIWRTSEGYRRKKTALRAIEILTEVDTSNPEFTEE